MLACAGIVQADAEGERLIREQLGVHPRMSWDEQVQPGALLCSAEEVASAWSGLCKCCAALCCEGAAPGKPVQDVAQRGL